MAKTVVADAGPLIAFARLNLMPLLPKVLGKIVVPQIVYDECLYVPSRPDAMLIKIACEEKIFSIDYSSDDVSAHFPSSLGRGEMTAIVLTKKLACNILVDDRLARKFASNAGLQVIGSAGVLIKAKQLGLIRSVKPLLEKLNTSGYRLSSSLVKKVLQVVGE